VTHHVDFGLLVLRVVVGLTMASHGFNKFYGGGRIAGAGRWFDSIGMRPGQLHARLAASAEIVAGLLLTVGFLTSLTGAVFVTVMFVAAYTVHKGSGFFVSANGWEYNLVLATVGVALAISGPGIWSIDALTGLADTFDGLTGFFIAFLGGVVAAAMQLGIFYRPRTKA